MKDPVILGITTSGHGVGGCLCVNGEVVCANTLERITRKRYDILLPMSRQDMKTFGWDSDPESYRKNLDIPFDLENDYSNVDFGKIEGFNKLLDHLLGEKKLTLKDVDCVAYSYRHNDRVKDFFLKQNSKIKFVVPEHHLSHACQAFYASPFEEAAIMVVDGQGVPLERTGGDPLSGCIAYGRENKIEILHELSVMHSLGGFYAYLTRLCGFRTNEEGKTMGLAPYGTPAIYEQYKHNVEFHEPSGPVDLLKRVVHHGLKGVKMPKALYYLGNYVSFFEKYQRRVPGSEITQLYMDIAYAAQKVVEDVMVYLANMLYDATGSKNLCISGGVGLNCVANYQVLMNSKFKNIFVYPNAGDNGLCVGQALYVHNGLNANPRTYSAGHDYLGKSYTSAQVKNAVDSLCRKDGFSIREYDKMQDLYDEMAVLIEQGKITSWWQGRSEFGPRALGNRSIIADPRRPDMKDILNSRVKFREAFRPFAPSVLAEKAGEYFVLDTESPYMLLAPKVRPGIEKIVPSITHVDNTARVQTVKREDNDHYYGLIKAFEKRTGIPMVLDTSFNIAGEPIVETPEDAIRCFMSTDIDMLGIGKYLIRKKR